MMPNCFDYYSVRTSCRCSIMTQVFRYSTADWKVELTTFIGSETGSSIPFKHDLPLLDMNIDDLIFSRINSTVTRIANILLCSKTDLCFGANIMP